MMKVLALDYGSARTGVAVSDPTGTMARAGGKDAERLPEALAEAERLIRAAL